MCCVLIDIHVLLFPFFHSLALSARVFPYSCSFSLFLLSCSARCSWPSSNQSPNDATTHLFYLLSRFFARSLSYFFLSLSRTQSIVSLSLARLSLLIVYFLSFSLARSPYTHDAHFFYMCVCVRSFLFISILCVCLCSSFIDYLNVTTKLDISTSSNKLGFVFF